MSRRTVLAGSIFTAVIAALGAVAAWPIYASAQFLIVAAAAVLAGAGIAALSAWRKWPWWSALLLLVAGWLLIGVGLAMPARWTSGTMVPDGLRDAVAGAITGWKDLATAPLPVGEYRNLLVPALIAFLLVTFSALRLSWREHGEGIAVPVAAMLPLFGLVFGRTSVSSPLQLGSMRISAPVELATGVAVLLASVLWLAWRARERRRVALRLAQDHTGIGQASQRRGAGVRRVSLAAGMVVVAVAAGTLLTGPVADERTREVLHTAIGPDLSRTDTLSPLTTYRNAFTDERFAQTLFTVSSTGEMPERIRLATLTDYDGEVFRTAYGDANAFLRVPSVRPIAPGHLISARIDVGTLDGAWLPMFGSLRSVEFGGADAPALADRFYYSAATGTAVESGGVEAGSSYTVTASVPDAVDLAEVPSPGARAQLPVPPMMAKWLEGQDVTRDGAGLEQIIQTLRSRGYLSHALERGEGESPAWMQALDDYEFRPSQAGHSLARVDELFSQLLDREAQTEGVTDPVLVAAVGDDEQFAVAGAIIAQQLGFPSRVVVGVRTQADDGIPACAEGVCRAGDLSAWIEVRIGDGTWVALDTTPQHTQRVETEELRERDPENMTEVQPQTPQEVAPPEPQTLDNTQSTPQDDDETIAESAWGTVRIGGIALLALIFLITPFLVIVFAKLIRRHGRRDDASTSRSIAGGWEEYVDTAVDAGFEAPGSQTRQELAWLYGTPAAPELAARADQAVFGGTLLARDASDQFWEIVTAERRALRRDLGFWGRIRAGLSLKSFTRQLTRRARAAKRHETGGADG